MGLFEGLLLRQLFTSKMGPMCSLHLRLGDVGLHSLY